ncbi:uncharacterized protein B0J16DRAFT_182879 [Fusarium flagelliforme]|uniref:uncharacterized protein n=1 Tax=Fusarium flagelliforme TaxID=2675880 RepID=UPI001E8D6697|nr:uncharacterized protein B0J16DRAFT_182879 [Fusarium flagelliforme]KAH7174531.1 hypothetical protein B0J16DRAFT_182879 [Fusarium flagelliforme]
MGVDRGSIPRIPGLTLAHYSRYRFSNTNMNHHHKKNFCFFFSSSWSFALTILKKRCRLNFGYFTNTCPLTLFLVLGMTMPYSRPWMISGKLFCLMFAAFFAFRGKIYFRFVGCRQCACKTSLSCQSVKRTLT